MDTICTSVCENQYFFPFQDLFKFILSVVTTRDVMQEKQHVPSGVLSSAAGTSTPWTYRYDDPPADLPGYRWREGQEEEEEDTSICPGSTDGKL